MHPKSNSRSAGQKEDSKGVRKACGSSQVVVACLNLVGGLDILMEDSLEIPANSVQQCRRG